MLKHFISVKPARIYTFCAFGVAVLMFIIAQVSEYLGIKFNVSDSMPVGLWKLREFKRLPFKNNVVVLCPPPCLAVTLADERGYFGAGPCPNGSAPLLKPVVAVAGDRVEITLEGIKINDQLLPNSAVRTIDGAGRFMPRIALGYYRVNQGQVWLISSFNSKSFDSRYFGPISVEQISHYATPVWLKGY